MTPSNEMCPICDYAGSAIYCEWPGPEQRRGGVIPLDSLPAAWWNNMWGDTTKRINEARDMIGQLITEVNNVLAQAGICPSDVCTDQLYQSINLIRQRLATTTTAGSVVGSADANKVAVAADGTMTVNCFGNANSLTTTAHTITGAINELKSTYDSCISNINSAVAGKAPTSHASSATTYGVGTASAFGHLKISDTYATVVGAATDGVAASQKALNDVYAYASACAARIIDLGNTAGCSLGTASAGVSGTAARSDHVHPMPTYVACSGYADNAGSAGYATDANHAAGADYATSAGSAGYAGNAGTVSNYGVSADACADTVAVRNSSGYLYASIFHDSWGSEDINSYAGSTLMFRSPDGFIRNTPPGCVSVGYANNAGSAGSANYAADANHAAGADYATSANWATGAGCANSATSAGSASSADAVHGNVIGAQGLSNYDVYAINDSTICNKTARYVLAVLQEFQGDYFRNAILIPPNSTATMANNARGSDFWISIW